MLSKLLYGQKIKYVAVKKKNDKALCPDFEYSLSYIVK